MDNHAITLQSITKSFNNKLILDHIDLTIYEGDIVSFIGENGSGKSTIIKMIAGLVYQDEGTIQVFGIDNHHSKIREYCEFVFESGLGFYGYLSAYENIRYFIGLNRIKFKTVQNEFDQLCKKWNFEQHLYKKVDTLSQGNRQKMALILALLMKPKILLLDEPTNGLDEHSVDTLADLLIDENKERKMTVLMTSHDMPFLEKLHAKRIVVEDKLIKLDE